MEKLKPCPFCGAELEYEEHIAIKVAGHPLLRLWAHPSGRCILAGLEVPQDDHEAWNRRILCRRNRQNPAADVRPVVLCRDCKHSDTFAPDCTEATFPLKCLSIRYGGVYPNWFCEHGEMREES